MNNFFSAEFFSANKAVMKNKVAILILLTSLLMCDIFINTNLISYISTNFVFYLLRICDFLLIFIICFTFYSTVNFYYNKKMAFSSIFLYILQSLIFILPFLLLSRVFSFNTIMIFVSVVILYVIVFTIFYTIFPVSHYRLFQRYSIFKSYFLYTFRYNFIVVIGVMAILFTFNVFMNEVLIKSLNRYLFIIHRGFIPLMNVYIIIITSLSTYKNRKQLRFKLNK